jgi:thiamine-phosphate pyrophosphorylase
MNDRPDLAVLAEADGVHVGQGDLTAHEARRIVGSDKLVGVSTHSIEQARQAVLDGADYIGVGPVFSSRTKEFDEFVGLEYVQQVASEITLPAFAIGGIGVANLSQVVDAGASRIAVSSEICSADDVERVAARMKETLLVKHA